MGCHHCQGVMARCLLNGYGCVRDEERSLELARESSGKGSRYGQYVLGELYQLGEGGLRRITPRLLRCIGLLQRRHLIRRSSDWVTCTSMASASPKTSLKRCGCTSLLPPKESLKHCTTSRPVTMKVKAFVRTGPKPFFGTGALKQRVTVKIVLTVTWNVLCTGQRSYCRAKALAGKPLEPKPRGNKICLRVRSSSSSSSSSGGVAQDHRCSCT